MQRNQIIERLVAGLLVFGGGAYVITSSHGEAPAREPTPMSTTLKVGEQITIGKRCITYNGMPYPNRYSLSTCGPDAVNNYFLAKKGPREFNGIGFEVSNANDESIRINNAKEVQ